VDQINFVWDIGVRIGSKTIKLMADSFITAVKQSPYIPGYNIRLVMPRVKFYYDSRKICISKVGFGPGWQRIARESSAGSFDFPKYDYDMEQIATQLDRIAPIAEMVSRAEKLHSEPEVKDELKEQADLFVEKSEYFAEYGMCPRVKSVFEVTPKMDKPFWPHHFSGSLTGQGNPIWHFNIQMTQAYMKAHHTIYAVELEDVRKLPCGSWNDDGTNPHIRTYKTLDCHPTNIINGYYIDWEIYGWDKEIIK
jgi:hypothetical protein